MKRLSLCLLLSGCQAFAQRPIDAVLQKPNEEIPRTVAQMLGVSEVKLAKNALMNDSQLLIERSKLQGLSLEKPEVFRLSLLGKRCWLTRVNTGEKRELKEVMCKEK
ncbi:hypothetical protein [Iodobacter fluviatilis]|uniref:Lipoprotein n=1 Tax=Iodobacter fluviatilis TaxID=537 RepID=A0A377SUM1_9NEIS|nr:hypothetical protein [Iodobacter fluviatilis]TCU88221.1 hypothetical protein EV682_104395 [Iodobacter fluviatilis]STR45722.1 Uncharacterised protein [Iodobacter fluviatilis]